MERKEKHKNASVLCAIHNPVPTGFLHHIFCRIRANGISYISFLTFFIVTFLFIEPNIGVCQQIDKKRMVGYLDSLNRAMPREKLYVHFDKSTYAQSDTLWFKGYLVDATLSSPTKSGLVYTEIINAAGEVVQSLSLSCQLGLTWGSYVMDPINYPPGKYLFRAYTNWMQNFGSHYFFKKDFTIISTSLEENSALKGSTTRNVRKKLIDTTAKKSKIDLQFLPEGGTWIDGFSQKMAFKVVNDQGMGISLSGEIVDSKQNRVVKFTSNTKGMGFFTMKPSASENYSVNVDPRYELHGSFPKAKANGAVLQLKNNFDNDSLTISVSSNLGEPLILIGETRGNVCFLAEIKPSSKQKSFTFHKNIFPSGVSHLLLLDFNRRPLAERTFFLNHHDQLQVSLQSDQKAYGCRDSIPIVLKVTDANGKPIQGSFSIAVTDDRQVLKDSVTDGNILSYFLLTSDLKGTIEDPGSYFTRADAKTHDDLEALLLTQGWIGYELSPAPTPKYKAETDFTISGRIRNIMNKPIGNANIILLGQNKGLLLLQTTTNGKGEFVFDQLPLLDSASFVIQAKNMKNKVGTIGVELNELKRPTIELPLKNLEEIPAVLDSTTANFVAAQNQIDRYRVSSGVQLKTVNIIAKKAVKNSKNLNGPGEASQIITEAELNRTPKKTLLDVLQEKVKGFRSGTRRKSFVQDYLVQSDQVKLSIDGIFVDAFYTESLQPSNSDYYHFVKTYLDSYNAEDIAGIEYMGPGFAGRYASKYNTMQRDDSLPEVSSFDYCFIEVTTRTGAGPFLKKSSNIYLYRPQNYGDNRVFYSPKYTAATKTDKMPDLRSTLYWNPNLITNEKGEAKTSFFSSDRTGSYTIWVEGSDTQGNVGMKAVKILISKTN